MSPSPGASNHDVIERIWKDLRDQKYHLKFTNGVELLLKERNGDISGLFRQQLHWLIRRHFQKKAKLAPLGIKCLSLIFIDKVDNYVRDDGKIRLLFEEEYASIYRELHGTDASTAQIKDCQGYYFAKTGGDEYTDSENAMLKNKKIFDEILRDKRALLDLENPREFIFSHSALGVGWDNPKIFNIATLNESYSDVKKRQELGRGLRICRNQAGHRVYDSDEVKEGMRPTGRIHIGHYHGALRNWLRLQEEHECLFFVADWHALTTHYGRPRTSSAASGTC